MKITPYLVFATFSVSALAFVPIPPTPHFVIAPALAQQKLPGAEQGSGARGTRTGLRAAPERATGSTGAAVDTRSLDSRGKEAGGAARVTADRGATMASGAMQLGDNTPSYFVQVASLRSVGLAESEWRRISDANQGVLAGARSHIEWVDIEGRGIFYRVLIGPMTNKGNATTLCGLLRQNGQNCLVRRRTLGDLKEPAGRVVKSLTGVEPTHTASADRTLQSLPAPTAGVKAGTPATPAVAAADRESGATRNVVDGGTPAGAAVAAAAPSPSPSAPPGKQAANVQSTETTTVQQPTTAPHVKVTQTATRPTQHSGSVIPRVDEMMLANIVEELKSNIQGREAVSFPDHCAHSAPGRLTSSQRLNGQNLELLTAAQYVLAPNYDPGEARTALTLLANYQEELEKRQPDALVAASYLALTATRPVTVDVVGRVNALLCLTSTKAMAERIATGAEDQRRAMKPTTAN